MVKNSLDEAIKKDVLVIGFKSVVKAINQGLISQVFVSSNGKVFLSKLKLISGGVDVRLLSISSKELGVKCKKPFNIAVLGVKGGEKDLKVSSKKKTKKPAKKTKKPVKKKASAKKKTVKKPIKKRSVKGKKK